MVYLVEDDISVVRSFRLLLDSHRIDLRSFSTAEEFLQTTNTGVGDILILDINLPGMKGTEVLKVLHESGTRIPVIIVTAFEDSNARKICSGYGVKAYMRKPVNGKALIDLIEYNLYVS
jgi:FixJ family two-component response regulator